MRLRHIDIFYAIMTTGSVSAAARRLNMTQPAATRLLQHAEQQLGFPLFERIKQRMVPTEQASLLFPEAQAAYRHMERFERLARQLKKAAGGQLSILATTVLAHRILPDVVKSLHIHFPEAQLEIGTGHSLSISQDLSEHRADVGIVFRPQHIPEGLSAIALSHSPLCCAYPKQWPTPKRLPHDLQHRPFISIQEDDPLSDILKSWFHQHAIDPHIQFLANNRPLVLKMIDDGMGWSILDQKNIMHYTPPSASIAWQIMPDLPPAEVIILTAKNRPKNPLLERFIHICRNIESNQV